MDTKQDNTTTTSEPRAITAPVMDIQRPRQIPVSDPAQVSSAPMLDVPAPETQTPEQLPESEPKTEFVESPSPQSEPAQEEPLTPEIATEPIEAPAETEEPLSNETGSIPAVETPPENQEQATPTTPADNPPASPLVATAKDGQESHKGPIGAVIAAVAIAVLLAGLTVTAYLQGKDNKAATNKANTVSQPANISGTDVDQTTTQVDESLTGADDAQDFGTTDLSDSALGL